MTNDAKDLETTMKLALIFPGQGSQTVGMGLDFYTNFPVAKHVFEEVDEALHQKLSTLMFEGSQETLTLTENTQPALMAVSMAIMAVLEQELGKKLTDITALMAGHSLGEYTAYCAAQTFRVADTAHLLRLRGQSMQRAVPVGQGAMAAILGPSLEDVELIAQDAALDEFGRQQVCVVANDNAPGQVVVSGHKDAIDRAISLALERGAKRALLLPVSAPFHSPLMEPASWVMAEALAQTHGQNPLVPIVSNVTTEIVTDVVQAKSLLVDQVTGRVRWRESMVFLQDQGITHVIEIGSGKVLTGLLKRIAPDLVASSVNSPADVADFLSLIAQK